MHNFPEEMDSPPQVQFLVEAVDISQITNTIICEMSTASSRNWTCGGESISYNHKRLLNMSKKRKRFYIFAKQRRNIKCKENLLN